MRHAIVYVNIEQLPKAKAEAFTKKMLDKIKTWAPELSWLAIPVRDQDHRLEFMDF